TRSAFEQRQKEISEKKGEKQQELREKKREEEECLRELEEWRQYREPEPAHSEEVERSRQILKEKGIPFFPFYKLVDFDSRLDEKQAARLEEALLDRKSTRLNSSHASLSYAVFCLKKKNN